MPSTKQTRRPPSSGGLHAIPYENTAIAKPPIPIDYPNKIYPNKTVNRLRKSRSQARVNSQSKDDTRKDSGLETVNSSARASRSTLPTDVESARSSIRKSASLPSFRARPDSRVPSTPKTPKSPISSGMSRNERLSSAPNAQALQKLEAPSPQPFLGLKTEIPTGSFEDLTAPGLMDFSKRGSMLLGGKKAVAKREGIAKNAVVGSRRKQNEDGMNQATIASRVLSTDEVAVSNRVRSMYEDGGLASVEWPLGKETLPEPAIEAHPALHEGQPSIRIIDDDQLGNGVSTPDLGEYGAATQRIHSILRQANELAGGIEDWEDVNNGDVDRYGFIVPRKLSSTASSLHSDGRTTPNTPGLHRTSTLLQLASETPRRSNSRNSKGRSTQSPVRSADLSSRRSSRLLRPTSALSQTSTHSAPTSTHGRRRNSRFLPSQSRRTLDDAGDMLTLPPGLADIAEDSATTSSPLKLSAQKQREYERDEKWRRMAKSSRDIKGSGTSFTFDTSNQKLIERTWKGIPDKWRATAWHSFLTTSANKQGRKYPSDDELKRSFADLLEEPSSDDMQIDIDVPRTISSHIMFRRRYRGGQRLLFRVLHCMSLYFPEIGYVQGMAALVATLLCYFDEEMTFVMMVRLWTLRGLEKLYVSGFEGLMRALEEFEGKWLGGQGSGGGWGKDVKARLDELGITSTSYGTRWYLTLFNYSIPFPAQLRVWDVFMLLGDESAPSARKPSPQAQSNGAPTKFGGFNGGLDVLHAVSLALIDGMREILLDSDFENAMKTLTSWIPVRDEECLMKVARCEWKVRRGR